MSKNNDIVCHDCVFRVLIILFVIIILLSVIENTIGKSKITGVAIPGFIQIFV